MWLKQVGSAVGDFATGTVGVVGSVAGGVACGTGGLISGTFKGDPLGGLERGVNDGVTNGGQVGRVVGGATVGAVGVVGKGVLVAGDMATATGTLAVNTVNRTVESSCRGTFLEASNSDVARLSAFLSADVYNLQRRGGSRFNSTSLTVNSCNVTVQLRSWTPSSNLRAAVYQVLSTSGTSDGTLKANDLILCFKGTDLDSSTNAEAGADKTDDLLIILGLYNTGRSLQKKEKLNEHEMWKCPHQLKAQFGGSSCRLYVTGHSLGGAAATIYSSHVDNYPLIQQTNVFNPGTGFSQNDCDAANVGDWAREFSLSRMVFRGASVVGLSEAKVFVHHIYGDGISALTTGSDAMSVTTYSRHPQIHKCHSITNFTSGEMDRLIQV